MSTLRYFKAIFMLSVVVAESTAFITRSSTEGCVRNVLSKTSLPKTRASQALHMAFDPLTLADGSSHAIDAVHHIFNHHSDVLSQIGQGIADASAATADAVQQQAQQPKSSIFDVPIQFVETSIVTIHDFLKNSLGVQNAYGPSIILFTLAVKIFVFPLNYKTYESSNKMQALAPLAKELKERYPKESDKSRLNLLNAVLYREAQVNPLGGCIPALIQIPVFISLYRALTALAQQQILDEPFLWLPNLQGPVYDAGRGSQWLFEVAKWHDGAPPLGWHDTILFLTVPILLVLSQSISLKISSAPVDENDEQAMRTQRILKYLPLMIGYFSLSVPSGLGVYWLANNILTTAGSIGVKNFLKAQEEKEGGPDVKIDDLCAMSDAELNAILMGQDGASADGESGGGAMGGSAAGVGPGPLQATPAMLAEARAHRVPDLRSKRATPIEELRAFAERSTSSSSEDALAV